MKTSICLDLEIYIRNPPPLPSGGNLRIYINLGKGKLVRCSRTVGLFLWFSLVGTAQISLPSDIYTWDAGAGTNDWSDGANWYHTVNDNTVPPDDAAAFWGQLEGKTHEDREEITFGSDTSVGSLWFSSPEDAPAYTLLGGAGATLTLGKGLGNDAQLIAVLGSPWSRETRILADTIKIDTSAGDNLRISNWSYGGLLIGGRSWGAGEVHIGSRAIQVFGGDELGVYSGAATHIASAIHGSGDISVYGHRAQLILSGDNVNWTGDLVVKNWPNAPATLEYGSGAIAVLKDNAAVGAANRIAVERGGSLLLRHATNAPTNTTDASGLTISAKEILITGSGALRGGGEGFSGALVNEAGHNTITSDIYFVDDGNPLIKTIWINARAGSTLTLTGKIKGMGNLGFDPSLPDYRKLLGTFNKDGLGTVILEKPVGTQVWEENEWSTVTNIAQGELRIKGSQWALSGGFGEAGSWVPPALQFSGGVLGLDVEGVDFTRKVGDGSWGEGNTGDFPVGSVRWEGRGGFLARGTTTKTVNLTVAHDEFSTNLTPGGTLNWHKGGFMGSWERREVFGDNNDNIRTRNGGTLVLGSETYEGYLIWKNAIYFGNHAQFQTEYETLLAQAGLSWGFYSNARVIEVQEGVAEMQGALSGEGFVLAKRGKGLLRLTSTESSYDGGTRIEAGALQGDADNLSFSNILLSGGVYMPNMTKHSNGIFNVTLGTGGEEFRWFGGDSATSGGFAAGESNTTIQIGTDPVTTPLAWGSEFFAASGRELILGHALSGATLTWDKALSVGDAVETIRVARGRLDSVDYDAVLNQSITGTGGLRVVGNGRIALRASNTLNTVTVLGAAVTLDGAGAFGDAEVFVSEAGTLVLDNRTNDLAGRLSTSSTLTLDAGTFHYRNGSRSTETLGTLKLAGGSNALEIEATGELVMEFAGFERNEADRATLDLMSDAEFSPSGVRLKFPTAQAAFAEFGDMSPWATINGTHWAIQDTTGTVTQLANYVTTAPGATWTTTGNVNIGSASHTLDQSRTIRSLRLGSGELNLGANQTLTLNSGGLLFASGAAGKLSGGGSITTSSGGTIYAHVYGGGSTGSGTAEIGARVIGDIDFVKTGPETLRLTSDGTSNFRNIYVHGGRLELDLGVNGRINTTGKIIVGDRAGKDVLRLPKYDNQLVGKPDVLLRGGKRGEGEAVLEFSFDRDDLLSTGRIQAATHRLNKLEVDGLGVIDFRGGEVGHANYLYIDELSFTEGSKLIIRNWFEYEDYLLIKRTAAHAELLSGGSGFTRVEPPIEFEGYGSTVTWTHYNDDYWEVTPFGRVTPFPEPSTYGAILGAVGLGLIVWRRRKQRLSK